MKEPESEQTPTIPTPQRRTAGRALNGLLRRVRRHVYQQVLTAKAAPGRMTPRPLDTVLAEGTLPPPDGMTVSGGGKLRNPFLARALAGDELGTWALDAWTINLLENEISSRRPTGILEFGAGLSTVCFARFMQEAGLENGPVVFSIEQNEWQVERSRDRLARLGLSHLVAIQHAPLTVQTIEGLPTECYELPAPVLNDFLGDARPEFVVVDGPAGEGTVRFGTLPLVRHSLAPGAVFFLDDALRPEELAVAQRWTDLTYLDVVGIYPTGKGLLTGSIRPREHLRAHSDR